ncbi:MAG: hypothetical protein FWH04_06650 [Oscillospiraceae bacterium]|nr:hypothetical protein [Oscillospiraceae bacterium]
MKLFWKRWWIVFGLSVIACAVSFFLMWGLAERFPKSGFLANLDYFFIGLPATYYCIVFVLSFFVCKRNIKQSVIVAVTSPMSVAVHFVFFYWIYMSWIYWLL